MIPDGLNYDEVPASKYAIFKIKPKRRLAWGITIGRMKRYSYYQWLPQSRYEPFDVIDDSELHDNRSLGDNPEI